MSLPLLKLPLVILTSKNFGLQCVVFPLTCSSLFVSLRLLPTEKLGKTTLSYTFIGGGDVNICVDSDEIYA